VGQRFWAALAGWWRRLRGAPQPPVKKPGNPPIDPGALAHLPDKKKRGEVRTTPRKRPSKAAGRILQREKGSSMDGAELTLDQLCRYLDDDGFGHSVREDGTGIETGFRARTGTFHMLIFLRQDPALVGAIVRIPEIVPEPKRPQMADALARANYGLSLGCFELDMSTGELDFRVSMPTAGANLSHEQFRALLGSAMWTTDRYHRALCRLIYADDLSPAEVIAEVEMAEAERNQARDQ
jgi:hypothetical protein